MSVASRIPEMLSAPRLQETISAFFQTPQVDLRCEQVDFKTASRHVRRVKKGTPSNHPILGDELRALRRLHREQEPKSPFVFTSERGSPFTTAGFARMIERAGKVAKLVFKAHPHMLRHACGFSFDGHWEWAPLNKA